jgi:hypothetical protein
MKTSLILLMAAAMTGFFLAAAPAQVNVSGEWTFTMTTPRGDRTSDVTFVQDGEKLTVTMKSERGEATGEGTVKGEAIEWTVTRQTPRGEMTVNYKGKIADDSTMEGEAQMGDFGTMAWKAVRKSK